MTLARFWAGRVFGTNTGNIFVKLEGNDDNLLGDLRFNEQGVGIVVYSIRGTFDGVKLRFSGEPKNSIDGYALGTLTATADLNAKGELKGEWDTRIGSAGTLFLFPHDKNQDQEYNSIAVPDQLHTARHNFGAIEVNREQITAIADEIQKDFKNGTMIVTVATTTEQSKFLPDFKKTIYGNDRVSIIKLFLQETESSGLNRIAQVEFGPRVNNTMTQGGDEAWVLGTLEKIKRNIRPYERAYTTNLKKFGFGIN